MEPSIVHIDNLFTLIGLFAILAYNLITKYCDRKDTQVRTYRRNQQIRALHKRIKELEAK